MKVYKIALLLLVATLLVHQGSSFPQFYTPSHPRPVVNFVKKVVDTVVEGVKNLNPFKHVGKGNSEIAVTTLSPQVQGKQGEVKENNANIGGATTAAAADTNKNAGGATTSQQGFRFPQFHTSVHQRPVFNFVKKVVDNVVEGVKYLNPFKYFGKWNSEKTAADTNKNAGGATTSQQGFRFPQFHTSAHQRPVFNFVKKVVDNVFEGVKNLNPFKFFWKWNSEKAAADTNKTAGGANTSQQGFRFPQFHISVHPRPVFNFVKKVVDTVFEGIMHLNPFNFFWKWNSEKAATSLSSQEQGNRGEVKGNNANIGCATTATAAESNKNAGGATTAQQWYIFPRFHAFVRQRPVFIFVKKVVDTVFEGIMHLNPFKYFWKWNSATSVSSQEQKGNNANIGCATTAAAEETDKNEGAARQSDTNATTADGSKRDERDVTTAAEESNRRTEAAPASSRNSENRTTAGVTSLGTENTQSLLGCTDSELQFLGVEIAQGAGVTSLGTGTTQSLLGRTESTLGFLGAQIAQGTGEPISGNNTSVTGASTMSNMNTGGATERPGPVGSNASEKLLPGGSTTVPVPVRCGFSSGVSGGTTTAARGTNMAAGGAATAVGGTTIAQKSAKEATTAAGGTTVGKESTKGITTEAGGTIAGKGAATTTEGKSTTEGVNAADNKQSTVDDTTTSKKPRHQRTTAETGFNFELPIGQGKLIRSVVGTVTKGVQNILHRIFHPFG